MAENFRSYSDDWHFALANNAAELSMMPYFREIKVHLTEAVHAIGHYLSVGFLPKRRLT